jgi:hypothetical protein
MCEGVDLISLAKYANQTRILVEFLGALGNYRLLNVILLHEDQYV